MKEVREERKGEKDGGREGFDNLVSDLFPYMCNILIFTTDNIIFFLYLCNVICILNVIFHFINVFLDVVILYNTM